MQSRLDILDTSLWSLFMYQLEVTAGVNNFEDDPTCFELTTTFENVATVKQVFRNKHYFQNLVLDFHI